MRRRRPAGGALRHPAHRTGRTRRDQGDRRRPHPRHPGPGFECARLLGVARGPGTRHRGAPRRHAARLQGGRRGTLSAQAAQGRLRDRDAGARRQHAGSHRGAREAGEVQRRGARADHAGGVHPAHRPGRTSRDRRGGARRHPVGGGARPGRGGVAGLAAQLPADLELPADIQHGRQPDRAVRARSHARDPRELVRPVPSRPGGRRPRAPGARAGGLAGEVCRGDAVPSRRLPGVLGPAPRTRRPREEERARRRPRRFSAQREPQRARQAAAAHRRTAQADEGAPLPQLRGARGALPVGRTLVAVEARDRAAELADPRTDRCRGSGVRPGDRRAARAWLPRDARRGGHRRRARPLAAADLRRTRSAGRRMPAPRHLERSRRPEPGRRDQHAHLRAAPRGGGGAQPAARAVPRGHGGHRRALGATQRPRGRAPPARQQPAIHRSGAGDSALGARRPTRRGAPRSRPRGGRFRAMDEAGHRSARPDLDRCRWPARAHGPRTRSTGSAAESSPTVRSPRLIR